MCLKDKIYSTLKELVAVPSVSGTEGEKLISEKIYNILSEMPYFKDNKEQFGLTAIENDPLQRNFVWGIVKGNTQSKDTVILTGHIDVVEVGEFAHLKSIAFDTEKCTKRINELSLDEEALRDFESGKWIFGRGTADMKSGIAMDLELIRMFSENREFKGNILFLGVPGEESNSEGMLAAVPFLLELQEKKEYNYVGAIVSECSIPKSENEDFKRVYMGSVGKIMPLFFCVGKETHVGESLKGLNPNLLVSEVNRLLEGNPDFCDKINNTATPPPMALKQMDLKELYSVQSPLFAAAYYNILTLGMSEEKLMDNLQQLAIQAFENVIKDTTDKREKYMKCYCNEVQFINVEPCVMTYKELLSEVRKNNVHFDEHLKEKVQVWKQEKKDNQTIAINIVKETYEKYDNKRPMIIVSIIPPYYPHRHLENIDDKSSNFIEVINKTIEYAQERFNEKLVKDDFFMAISDLSYTGIDKGENLNNLSLNIVGYDLNYNLPLEALKKLNIPGIVFGGEGKDFHKSTERLNVDYSLRVVPELYKNIIYSLLK